MNHLSQYHSTFPLVNQMSVHNSDKVERTMNHFNATIRFVHENINPTRCTHVNPQRDFQISLCLDSSFELLCYY